MVNKMRIELFHEKYIDEMISLFKESIRKICIKYYSPIQIEAWLSRANKTRWISNFKQNYTLLVFNEEILVGFGDITSNNYLNMLYVHPDYQNQAVATLICDELEKHSTGTITVDASQAAKNFFIKRGYKVIKEQTVVINQISLINFKMVKDVDKLRRD